MKSRNRIPQRNLLWLCVCVVLFRQSSCFSISPDLSRFQQEASKNRLCSHHGVGRTNHEKEPDFIETENGSHVSRGAFLSTLASAALVATTTPRTAEGAPTESSGPNKSTINNGPVPTFLNSKEEQRKTIQESISGFVAGGSLTITKTFVKYPLDTATVRLQMPGTDYSIRDPLRLFDGGYRGVLAPLLWNVPGGAVFFAVKDATKSALRESGLPRWATTSLAVAAAQCPYWLVRNPSEVVKTRQQAGVDGYGEGVSTWDAFRSVYEEGKANNGTGFDEFYSGYWENILYAYPADVIKFVCYDTITQGKKNLPPLDGAVAGAVSTAVAQLLTTPLDVVRNRVMAGEEPSTEKSPSYIGSLVNLAQEEGVAGLFAGASPRVGKAILSGAIQFATYEETKQILNAFFQSS